MIRTFIARPVFTGMLTLVVVVFGIVSWPKMGVDMFPEIETHLEEVPSKTNPLGVKGIGESGTIGAPPTVINAILDALKPYGVEQIDMPATPSRVWDAMQKAKSNTAKAA